MQEPFEAKKYGFSPDGRLRAFSPFLPGSNTVLSRDLRSYLSNFTDQVSEPLKDLRESIESQLREYCLQRFGEQVYVRIVHPDYASLLELPSSKESGKTIFSPAVLECVSHRLPDGDIQTVKNIYLCESIFTFNPNKDRTRNHRLQNAVAGRLIGMLFAQEYIDENPNARGSQLALLLQKVSGDTEHNARASLMLYLASKRGMSERKNPPAISRVIGWNVIESLFEVGRNTEVLNGTETNYKYLTRRPLSTLLNPNGLNYSDPIFGDYLETAGIAISKLSTFRDLSDVDIVCQAALLNYVEGSAYDHRNMLAELVPAESVRLSKALKVLHEFPFDVPVECATKCADFQLASVHQRFIQTLSELSAEHKVSPYHLCALGLVHSYIEALNIDKLPEKDRRNARNRSLQLYAAASDRLANPQLADDIRYAAFSRGSPEALKEAREMLSGYAGLDMRAARKLEKGFGNHLTKHFEHNTAGSVEVVKTQVRLKGYLSLDEKLKEIEYKIHKSLAHHSKGTRQKVMAILQGAVKGYRTGSLNDRRRTYEQVKVKIGELIKDQDLISKEIKRYLDNTDTLGIRLVVSDSLAIERLSECLEASLKEAIPQGGVTFHENLKVVGVREITAQETVNPDAPRRAKISDQAAVWRLNRYALKIAPQNNPDAFWEIPIEVQVISEDEYKNQKIGVEPRKYAYPHWWLKAVRGVVNDLEEKGKPLHNSFCGPQLHFTEQEHDGTSFTRAFDAASGSLDRVFFCVEDNRGKIVEMWDNYGTDMRASLEAIMPHKRYNIGTERFFERHLASVQNGQIFPGACYQVIEPRNVSEIPQWLKSRHQVLSFFPQQSEEQEEMFVKLGAHFLNDQCCRGALREDNPAYEKLVEWTYDYLPAYYKLDNPKELSRYIGILLTLRDNDEAFNNISIQMDIRTELYRLSQDIEQLIKYHFYFPEVTVESSGLKKKFHIFSKEHHPSLVPGLFTLAPKKHDGVPYLLVGGDTVKITDGEIIELVFDQMPDQDAEVFTNIIRGYAIPKGSESVFHGTPEVYSQLWLCDTPGVFLKVLNAAHERGLDVSYFDLQEHSTEKIHFDPHSEVHREYPHVYTKATMCFKWMIDPDGRPQDLAEKLTDTFHHLVDGRLLLCRPFGGDAVLEGNIIATMDQTNRERRLYSVVLYDRGQKPIMKFDGKGRSQF